MQTLEEYNMKVLDTYSPEELRAALLAKGEYPGELQFFTDNELKNELKRRNEEARKAKKAVKRCHMCEHWGTVDYWKRSCPDGHLTHIRRPKSANACCPFQHSKSGKYSKAMPAYTLACEHFSEFSDDASYSK